jgi:hypothetical protein
VPMHLRPKWKWCYVSFVNLGRANTMTNVAGLSLFRD